MDAHSVLELCRELESHRFKRFQTNSFRIRVNSPTPFTRASNKAQARSFNSQCNNSTACCVGLHKFGNCTSDTDRQHRLHTSDTVQHQLLSATCNEAAAALTICSTAPLSASPAIISCSAACAPLTRSNPGTSRIPAKRCRNGLADSTPCNHALLKLNFILTC
jgi:hypothetical protein